VIRERFKLRGKIKAISAHGRMTGMALSGIPIAVAALMFVTNRSYVTFFLHDEIGNYMAIGAILLQLIGYGVIQKIVQIEV
jgi:tight adherence protein B